MYIVRDKATRKILHVNPAPLSQALDGTDIYFQLDPTTMEVARGELPSVPEFFDIDEQGLAVPWTLERQVKEGVTKLPSHMKAVGDARLEKTLAEKVADGVMKLKPTEKLAGDHIVPKTPAEQVADGLIKLSPTQVVDGDHIREMTEGEKAAAGLIKLDPHLKLVGKQIVPKTPAELVAAELLQLAPNQVVKGDRIVQLNPREMHQHGRLDLAAYKLAVIDRFTEASLSGRRSQVPDYQLLYAAIGALDAATTEKYRKVAADHASALDQTIRSIQKASTPDEVDAIAGLGDWPQDSPSTGTASS